nr:hypothetical protein [Mycoplasmopsis bovis]
MKKSKFLILGSIASLSNYIMIAAKSDGNENQNRTSNEDKTR